MIDSSCIYGGKAKGSDRQQRLLHYALSWNRDQLPIHREHHAVEGLAPLGQLGNTGAFKEALFVDPIALLGRANLNLLYTLYVLLEERHVSRAALRLHLTQSAVSRQLGQLRALFADPLLLRQGNRLWLSPAAETLLPRVKSLLVETAQLLTPIQFEPHAWQGRCCFASSDYVAQYIFPELVQEIGTLAPQLRLDYRLWQPDFLPLLGEMDIQLASTMLDVPPDGLRSELIGHDHPCCLMHRSHPLAAQEILSLDQWVAYPQVSVSGGGDKDSFVDQALAQQGCARLRQCVTPFFSSALSIVCRSQMLLVVPEHIGHNLMRHYPVIIKALPLPSITYNYWLLWHPRYDDDSSHQWFRGHVLNFLRSSIYSVHDFKS